MAGKKKKEAAEPALRVVGEVVLRPIDSVAPNDWNPNTLTDFQKKSLRHGLKHDGWLISQAMLVWRTDEKGREKNLIIDGEHRWGEARALGFKDAPMVFLDGLPEDEAKKLTVKLDARRGQFDQDLLSKLLRSVRDGEDEKAFAIETGVDGELMARLLADPIVPPATPPSQFPEFDGQVSVKYKCPKCSFEWS